MLTIQQELALSKNGWIPTDDTKTLFINRDLFHRGIISFFDPNGCDILDGAQEFSVSQSRRVSFLETATKKSQDIIQLKKHLKKYLKNKPELEKGIKKFLGFLSSKHIEVSTLQGWLDEYFVCKRELDKEIKNSVTALSHKQFQKPAELKQALSEYVEVKKKLDHKIKEFSALLKSHHLPDHKELIAVLNEYLLKKDALDIECQNYLNFEANFELDETAISQNKLHIESTEYFNSSYPYQGIYLRNVNRKGEYYIPVIIRDESGVVTSSLYIHPQKIGEKDRGKHSNQYTSFHAETCLIGTQFECVNNRGEIKYSLKHDVTFGPTEKIVKIVSQPGDNSYETMQFEDVRLMAILMRAHSHKKADEPLSILVTHHLPWLDYILSGVLLFEQRRMEYQALFTLCELIIAKKIEHEKKLSCIYLEQKLNCVFVTPFANLLDPTKEITAESILQQLGVQDLDTISSTEKQKKNLKQLREQLASPSLESDISSISSSSYEKITRTSLLAGVSDHKEDDSEQLTEHHFVQKYLTRLIKNKFNPEQQVWWEKLIHAKVSLSKEIKTLDELLSIANTLVIALSASNSQNPCSFVSTQARQIQVEYEHLHKQTAIELPPATCFTSIPTFLTTSNQTRGSTFNFLYAQHSETIRTIIENNIVAGAIKNMHAWLHDGEFEPIISYLPQQDSPGYFV